MMVFAARNNIPPVQQIVYTRRKAAGVMPPLDGNPNEWQVDRYLRCNRVRFFTGAKVGDAMFEFIPQVSTDRAIEIALERYSVDDQVRVDVLPVEDELVQQANDENPVYRTLFEGVLMRHVAEADGKKRAQEMVSFHAVPMPVLGAQLSGHVIIGRWVATAAAAAGTTPGSFIVESPFVPAIFNQGGKPNKHATATIESATGELVAPAFTHDNDPTAKFWTLRDAIISVLVRWVYGDKNDLVPFADLREFDLEHDLADQLSTEPPLATRSVQYTGLDNILPEVNVHGLNALEALEKLCAVGGFEFAIEPARLDEGYPDRPYVMRLWRKHTGESIDLPMAKQASSYLRPEDAHRENQASNIKLMRDAAEIRNVIVGRSPEYIELVVPLLPMWNHSDWHADYQSPSLPPPIANGSESPSEEQLQSDSWYSYHVQGGANFREHVGRVWGVDCVGGLITEPQPTAGGRSYEQAAAGFDWLGHINSIGSKPLSDFRLSTQPAMQWTQRIRRALPLRSPAAKQTGLRYWLEVNENSLDADSWRPCPIKFDVLPDQFGIMLKVRNLAATNLDKINSGLVPRFAKVEGGWTEGSQSWFHLMATVSLHFRLHCCIEADHATLADAARRSTSGSGYHRETLVIGEQVKVWRAPDVITHPPVEPPLTAFWDAIYEPNEDAAASIEQTVRSRQDAMEGVRIAASGSTWRMDLMEYFKLGQRITKISGRDISLAVDGGADQRHPTIAGITYHLSPTEAQRIRLNLTDARLDGGNS